MSKKPPNRLGTGPMPSMFGHCLPHIPKPLQATYKAFYASLTPEQMASIGGKPHPSNLSGEVRPLLKDMGTVSPTVYEGEDASHMSLSDTLLAPTEPSHLPDEQEHQSSIPTILVLEIVRKVLHAWTSAPDRSTRLHGEVLGIALGIPGETVTSLSRKYGCTRQAISKRHRSIIKALSLPPSVRMVLARSKVTQTLKREGIAIPTKKKRLRGKYTARQTKKTPPTPSNQGENLD